MDSASFPWMAAGGFLLSALCVSTLLKHWFAQCARTGHPPRLLDVLSSFLPLQALVAYAMFASFLPSIPADFAVGRLLAVIAIASLLLSAADCAFAYTRLVRRVHLSPSAARRCQRLLWLLLVPAFYVGCLLWRVGPLFFSA